MAHYWPVRLDFFKAEKCLEISWDNGSKSVLPYEKLRVESPSAEVQGHHPDQKKTVTGKENVLIVDAQMVGRYGVQLFFDDGHNSGLYTWEYLGEYLGGNLGEVLDAPTPS